jgi:outer membrane protein OmpA-like peptidoglycan-associated protein
MRFVHGGTSCASSFWRANLLAGLLLLGTVMAAAAQSPFDGGWTLVKASSKLNFQSVKSQTIVESSSFVSFDGAIDPGGMATVKVALDSVDTGIDLRNVRMRFLFFETFRFPEAIVTTRLDPTALRDLPTTRRQPLRLKYNLTLHGVTREMESDVVVTLLTDSTVSVASVTPISVAAAQFDLTDGVKKLEDANQVLIIPSGSVTFDFVFQKNGGAAAPAVVARTPPASTAIETQGELSTEACTGRFEILSRTGAIYFRPGSAELDAESRPLLDSVIQIITRCPNLHVRVAGHTDATGVPANNMALSEARAKAVAAYLVRNGVAAGRLDAVGFGDTRPVAPNDSAWNKSRNRRIEFSAVPG